MRYLHAEEGNSSHIYLPNIAFQQLVVSQQSSHSQHYGFIGHKTRTLSLTLSYDETESTVKNNTEPILVTSMNQTFYEGPIFINRFFPSFLKSIFTTCWGLYQTNTPIHLLTPEPRHSTLATYHLFASERVHLCTCSPLRLFSYTPLPLFTSDPVRPYTWYHSGHVWSCSPLRLYTCSNWTGSLVHLSASTAMSLFTASPVHLHTTLQPLRALLICSFTSNANHSWNREFYFNVNDKLRKNFEK